MVIALKDTRLDILESSTNPSDTQANLDDVTSSLTASSQNPSGTISLKEGGLASKTKKKKSKK